MMGYLVGFDTISYNSRKVLAKFALTPIKELVNLH